MWNHLRKCGAPRGHRPNEREVPVGGLKGIMGRPKEDIERHSQTMSLAATLIATLTFAAALTMPGGYDDLGGATSLKKAALMIFIFSDTLAMCCSITVVSLLWRAMTVREGLKIVLNNESVKLLRIALYATLVAYMSGVFALIAPKTVQLRLRVFRITISECTTETRNQWFSLHISKVQGQRTKKDHPNMSMFQGKSYANAVKGEFEANGLVKENVLTLRMQAEETDWLLSSAVAKSHSDVAVDDLIDHQG
ncbi:hypothetical protein Vadar_029283 [Vaccinium darrowii]|uniref:Uncharacterized protein n=1 Tax=Vaccinium darrowii TaxID=229202 RepID=A0ACB7XUU2_9ERIC|nr:hypothetical protein Vadar_029283 [Vaccinium darrowii]